MCLSSYLLSIYILRAKLGTPISAISKFLYLFFQKSLTWVRLAVTIVFMSKPKKKTPMDLYVHSLSGWVRSLQLLANVANVLQGAQDPQAERLRTVILSYLSASRAELEKMKRLYE